MNWINKLENRFGHLAIPNILRYVAALSALVFVLMTINPSYSSYLELNPLAVLNGQAWRLITHVFIPQFGYGVPPWLGAAMYIMFLMWLGDGLEEALGAFRLNLYFFIGIIGVGVGAMLFGVDAHRVILFGTLFMAFAWFYPDATVMLFFIVPIKAKWIALLDALVIGIIFISSDWMQKVGVLIAMSNLILFFWKPWLNKRAERVDANQRRKAFQSQAVTSASLHRCAICHKGENDSPDLEFRVAKDGEEYCIEHLPGGNRGAR